MRSRFFMSAFDEVEADGAGEDLPEKGEMMELRDQRRTMNASFETREADGNLYIEGYFAVYNSVYQIAPDLSESIAPGAFDSSLGGDIRALINHDTSLVLGRTKANTLELRSDERGLWGRILVNPKDTDAMNAHARVERGDVSQCSIGFNILSEETEFREDGSVHWTIRDVELMEVSICTFPAYEETEISARAEQAAEIKKRQRQAWAESMKKKLKGGE